MTKDQIDPERFELVETLDVDALIPFVREHIKAKNAVTFSFNTLHLMTSAAILWALVNSANFSGILGGALAQMGIGAALAFTLVPIHEGLHALAYRLVGARDVRFTAHLRQFYFTAQAHEFVITGKPFFFVALLPIVVITFAAVAMALMFPKFAAISIGLIFAHNFMCAGDFALMSFFWQYRGKGMISYDDFDRQVAYFYVRKE